MYSAVQYIAGDPPTLTQSKFYQCVCVCERVFFALLLLTDCTGRPQPYPAMLAVANPLLPWSAGQDEEKVRGTPDVRSSNESIYIKKQRRLKCTIQYSGGLLPTLYC